MSWRTLKRVVNSFGLLLALASAVQAQGGTWTKKADMPTPRNSFAAAAVDGWIYTFGGRVSPNDGLPTVEAYHPATDQWVKKADMPAGRKGASAVVVDGKIYVMGGSTGSSSLKAFTVVEVYDPATDTWTRKADMLQPKSFTMAASTNGKVYLIGGWSTGAPHPSVQEYNPATDTWTEKTQMPLENSHLACVLVGNEIFAIGGISVFKAFLAYTPATDTWEKKEDLPIGRVLHGAAVLNGAVYVVGGMVSDDSSKLPQANVAKYDPSTGTWVEQAAMPAARAGLSAVAVDGRIYAIGGTPGVPWVSSKVVGTVEEFTPDKAQTAVEVSTWGKVKKQAP